MKKTLFYDTETTGLWNFKADLMAEGQPGIVQIAALLCEGDQVIAEFEAIVKPGIGYSEISEGAAAVHGISLERAVKVGIELSSALESFAVLAAQADQLVCHNAAYDTKLVARSAALCVLPNPIEGKPQRCTMLESTNYVGIMTKWNKFKWPKLEELHAKLFDGRKFENAHDALGDVKATKDCFFELINKGIILA